MNSRSSSPLPSDHAERVNQFIRSLYLKREEVASELEALSSIYGENAIRIWEQDQSSGKIRYEIDTNLPSYGGVLVKVVVSIPETYPSTTAPQLQLLSRYIGSFGVDQDLFGDILKTYISTKSGVEFVPGTVAVFDGLQDIIERCSAWYEGKLREEQAGETLRQEKRHLRINDATLQRELPVLSRIDKQLSVSPSILEGIELVEGEPIIDRKSVFIGRACRLTYPSQVELVLSYLMSDKHIARAAHPTINAWRCSVNGVMHQDNDDDGETAAGGRLAHLLQIMDLDHVLVVVTRFYGGILLGADRFKHINQAARSALEKGHFLDTDEKAPRRQAKKRN